jgi:hypothetical protein
VANRVDGVAEGIQDGRTGYLVHPGELDQAAQYCIHLAQDRVAREAFGRRGRKFARASFDLRMMITQIEDIYDAILSQPQPYPATRTQRRVGELRPVPVGAAWLNPPQLAHLSEKVSISCPGGQP